MMQEHKMVHEWHRAITLPPNKYHDPCRQKPELYIPLITTRVVIIWPPKTNRTSANQIFALQQTKIAIITTIIIFFFK